VGRVALGVVSVFFVGVVTMLVLVKLALSLTPCAKEGCTRRAINVSAIRPSRIIKYRKEEIADCHSFLLKSKPEADSTRALASAAAR
jgi:energy-converting hydrogenase Eha subunit A